MRASVRSYSRVPTVRSSSARSNGCSRAGDGKPEQYAASGAVSALVNPSSCCAARRRDLAASLASGGRPAVAVSRAARFNADTSVSSAGATSGTAFSMPGLAPTASRGSAATKGSGAAVPVATQAAAMAQRRDTRLTSGWMTTSTLC